MKKSIILIFSTVAASYCVFSAPTLKSQAEVLIEGQLKGKVLEYSRGIPPPTPQAETYRITRGTESRDVKVFNAIDLWLERACVGVWEDRTGNVMKLARVVSLVPQMDKMECTRDAVTKRLFEMESSFKGSEQELSAWKTYWGVKGTGTFIKLKCGSIYWVEFIFKETVKPAEVQRLFRVFERSLVGNTRGISGTLSSMKWWEMKDGKYRFLTDLPKIKGQKFIKDSLQYMSFLRNGFEYYIPPQRDIDTCVVRVFGTLAAYREYRSSTGVEDKMSCGLWDPSRDELLILAENPKRAMETMRHESFHQYLHYATACGNHAMWFNEGHATFFENIKQNLLKKSVIVLDTGNRAEWVNQDPVRYARQMRKILTMTSSEFYSGAVNDHYVTAWALIYFLERGSYTDKEFLPYRSICANYLKLVASGVAPEEATRQAWAPVADRDLEADFLKFWRSKRNQAATARERVEATERKSGK